MNVLRKLNAARKEFHGASIKKSGYNKFSEYYYFELADFLMPALAIFERLQLSGVVSFGVELASLTLTDLEDGSQFVITSPMSTAKLKACHEVQNLGAVETYIRRYLWSTALELVEHDAIDSGPGPEKETPRQQELRDLAAYMIECHEAGQDLPAIQAWYQPANWDKDNGAEQEERLAVWAMLKPYSKLRSAVKSNRPAEVAA
jgi:hypothetical protein